MATGMQHDTIFNSMQPIKNVKNVGSRNHVLDGIKRTEEFLGGVSAPEFHCVERSVWGSLIRQYRL